MVSEKDLDFVKQQFLKINPKKALDALPNNDCGINFVMKYLWENNNEAYTNELAKEMNASTARVSSLINKLEERGYVKRVKSTIDARKTMIVLTKKGQELNLKVEKEVDLYLTNLIEKVGVDELLHFIKIVEIMKETAFERVNEAMMKEKENV